MKLDYFTFRVGWFRVLLACELYFRLFTGLEAGYAEELSSTTHHPYLKV